VQEERLVAVDFTERERAKPDGVHSPGKGVGDRLREIERCASCQQVLPALVRFIDVYLHGVEQFGDFLNLVKKHNFAFIPSGELYRIGQSRFPDSGVVHRVAASLREGNGRHKGSLASLPCAGQVYDTPVFHGFNNMRL